MSNATIQRVMRTLQRLPESEQGTVLDFLDALRRRHTAVRAPARRRRNAAVKNIGGALVFTGTLGDPAVDWVDLVRSERSQQILQPLSGKTLRG